MENTEVQETEKNLTENLAEPSIVENSADVNEESEKAFSNASEIPQGQSQDPLRLKILGKFKNVDELVKAYSELEKRQGESSQELGKLRKMNSSIEDFAQNLQQALDLKTTMIAYLDEYREKYNKPEYFQNQAFREIYKAAFRSLGQKLDTDKFVELIENYATSRIADYNKAQSAKFETDNILSAMTYEKNPNNSLTLPKKSFDEMSEKEIDELLDRVI